MVRGCGNHNLPRCFSLLFTLLAVVFLLLLACPGYWPTSWWKRPHDVLQLLMTAQIYHFKLTNGLQNNKKLFAKIVVFVSLA